MAAAWAAMTALCLAGAPGAWGADAALAKLIEAAKKEGEVHYIDANVEPKTQAGLDWAFRKKYGLPESFKFTHTLQGTGQVVASAQQEIKAGRHTFDIVSVAAPSFFKAAAKAGDFLAYLPAGWKSYEGQVKRLGVEANPPNWITPLAYAFVPVWNRKCPGFANVQIKSWRDLLNPAFKGKLILPDVRKSFSYAASWAGMEAALGKDYFPKLVELTQPAIFFRTEENMQKAISCEYPISVWQLSGRVYQRMQEDPTLNLGVAWPQEGLTLLPLPFGILKGAPHPNAAKLLIEFFLSEEGVREYISGEAIFSLREGFKVPEVVRRYTPGVAQVKFLPFNWDSFTLQAVRKAQDDFRRVLKVD